MISIKTNLNKDKKIHEIVYLLISVCRDCKPQVHFNHNKTMQYIKFHYELASDTLPELYIVLVKDLREDTPPAVPLNNIVKVRMKVILWNFISVK